MSHFIVAYIDATGKDQREKVEAASKKDARILVQLLRSTNKIKNVKRVQV